VNGQCSLVLLIALGTGLLLRNFFWSRLADAHGRYSFVISVRYPRADIAEEAPMVKIRSAEITPEHLYLSRRQFLKGVGALAAGSALLSACGGKTPPSAGVGNTQTPPGGASQATDELGDPLTPYEAVTHYNNYYEFSTDKETVAVLAKDLKTSPWTVQVGGLVKNPKTYGIEDLLKKFTQEERLYRLRCVEAWSMVIPWQGFQLSELLEEVEPTPTPRMCVLDAVRSGADARPMSGWFRCNWPYVRLPRRIC
jgi:sulfoxide reductase catalytic subunit YedY